MAAKKQKVYHGWIVWDKSPGYKDYYTVKWPNANDPSEYRMKAMGYGKNAESVDFFEKKLGRQVKLEHTPLGVRVYTLEDVPEEGT